MTYLRMIGKPAARRLACSRPSGASASAFCASLSLRKDSTWAKVWIFLSLRGPRTDVGASEGKKSMSIAETPLSSASSWLSRPLCEGSLASLVSGGASRLRPTRLSPFGCGSWSMVICSLAMFWPPLTFSTVAISSSDSLFPSRARRREGKVIVSMAVEKRADACHGEYGSMLTYEGRESWGMVRGT